MSGKPRNQEVAAQGAIITLDASFFEFNGGNLIDPDQVPTYKIFDPLNNHMFDGVAVKVTQGKYTASYPIPSNAPTGDTWRIEWFALINGAQVTDSQEFFRVVPAGSITLDGGIIISDRDLGQIKKVLAYPKIDFVTLEDPDIKEYAVYPAMYEYFRRFPIIDRQQYQVSNNAPIVFPFPDQFTFGAFYVTTVDKLGINRNTGPGGNFWDLIKYNYLQRGGQSPSRRYGTSFNFNGLRQQIFSERQLHDSLINEGTFKHYINYPQRQVECFSSVEAQVQINWAKESNDFSTIKHTRKFQVINLAQSYLLDWLADAASIVEDNGLDKKVNADALRQRAKDLRDPIFDLWSQEADVILLRMA